MRRARAPRNDFAADLALLGLKVPAFKCEDYADGLAQLAEWKTTVLKPAFRAAAKTTHPDHGGDEEMFKAVRAAYERASNVKLRRPRVAPEVGMHVHPFSSVIRMRRPMPGFNDFMGANSAATSQPAGDFGFGGWTVRVVRRG